MALQSISPFQFLGTGAGEATVGAFDGGLGFLFCIYVFL
jgi:hypothetical protein